MQVHLGWRRHFAKTPEQRWSTGLVDTSWSLDPRARWRCRKDPRDKKRPLKDEKRRQQDEKRRPLLSLSDLASLRSELRIGGASLMPIKLAVPRHCVHVCLLVAALAGNPVGGQTSTTGSDSAQRPAVDVAALDAAAAEVLEQRRQQTLEKHQRDGRSARARAAIGGVSVAARCVEGFVVNGTHRASASDVRIVAAEQRDCDGGRCRAYQVTAARDSQEPFDLEVSVSCS
jgi:hypothetical protein